MKKILLSLITVFLFSEYKLGAQNVGIGTSTPTQKLDIIGNIRSSTLAGVGFRAVLADATGTLTIATGATSPHWTTTGNTATVPGTNFIGTTDAVDFVTKTGGIAATNERMRVLSSGPIVVNNTGLGVSGVGDVFSVYSNGTTNGTSTNISALGAFAINGYSSGTGSGIYGENTGTGSGVIGNVSGGTGVFGIAASATGFGSRFYNANPSGTAIIGAGNNLGATYLINGSGLSIRGQNFGGLFFSSVTSAAVSGSAVYGINGKTNIISFLGGAGVTGIDSTSGTGVMGKSYGPFLDGVYGESGPDGNGITGFGIVGASSFPYGVYGDAGAGNGSIGVVGNVTSGGATRYGGFFNNDLGATGVKTFLMDHPQDPGNKFLKHFSMESPEVLNTYRGNVTCDANGEATVTMPAYFEAINNNNCTYHLTPVGNAANLYIKTELSNGAFIIAGGTPGLKISWMVMSERNDPYLQQNPEEREVVIQKTGSQTGKYLQPELYGKPASLGIFYKEKIMKRFEAGPQPVKSETIELVPARKKL